MEESYPDRLRFVLDQAKDNPKLLAIVVSKIRERMDSHDLSFDDKIKCRAILLEYSDKV